MVIILPNVIPCDNCIHEELCKFKEGYSNLADSAEKACVDHDGPFTVDIRCNKHRIPKPTERSAY